MRFSANQKEKQLILKSCIPNSEIILRLRHESWNASWGWISVWLYMLRSDLIVTLLTRWTECLNCGELWSVKCWWRCHVTQGNRAMKGNIASFSSSSVMMFTLNHWLFLSTWNCCSEHNPDIFSYYKVMKIQAYHVLQTYRTGYILHAIINSLSESEVMNWKQNQLFHS